MKTYITFLILAFVSGFTSTAFAGSRGYYLQISDLSSNKYFLQKFKEYRRSNKIQTECWSNHKGEGVAVAYISAQPVKVSQKIVDQVLKKDKKTIKMLSTKLLQYQDDQVSSGLDGLLVYTSSGKMPFLISVSKYGKVKRILFPQTIKFNVDELELALCKATKLFDSEFLP